MKIWQKPYPEGTFVVVSGNSCLILFFKNDFEDLKQPSSSRWRLNLFLYFGCNLSMRLHSPAQVSAAVQNNLTIRSSEGLMRYSTLPLCSVDGPEQSAGRDHMISSITPSGSSFLNPPTHRCSATYLLNALKENDSVQDCGHRIFSFGYWNSTGTTNQARQMASQHPSWHHVRPLCSTCFCYSSCQFWHYP